jgi:hypothetical protein
MKSNQRFSRIIKYLAGLMLGLILMAIVKPSSGQSLWSAPLAISPEGSFAWFPDILADPYGRVHAVWASGAVGFDQVYYASTDTGYSWTKPNDIFATPLVGNESYAARPSLLIDKNGHLNLTYLNSKAVNYSKSPIMKATLPGAWTPSVPINGSQPGYFSRMALDSQNTLHLVFTQNNPAGACPICYHIYHRQSIDDGNSWSPPVDIIKDAVGAVKPQMIIDKDDNIHLVWESGMGGGLGQLTNPTAVTYAASYDKGKTWSVPLNLSSSTEMGKNIAIGIDKSGDLVVAWLSLPSDLIKFQISSDHGKSWSSPSSIPGAFGAAQVYASNLDDYAFASDSDGYLHLAAVGRVLANQDTLNVLDLVWDGSQWKKPDIIATYKGDVPEWPRITISQGNQIYVIWFVRDQAHIWESDKGQYRVWLSRGYAPSQSVGALPLPTAAASGTAIPTNPTPTLTATSSVPIEGAGIATAVNNPQFPQTAIPTSEAQLLPLLAAAIIPSILLIIGVAIFKYMRSR